MGTSCPVFERVRSRRLRSSFSGVSILPFPVKPPICRPKKNTVGHVLLRPPTTRVGRPRTPTYTSHTVLRIQSRVRGPTGATPTPTPPPMVRGRTPVCPLRRPFSISSLEASTLPPPREPVRPGCPRPRGPVPVFFPVVVIPS